MLFLVRSAFCITAVVLALPDRPPIDATGSGAGGLAISALRQICQADPSRCMSVTKGALARVLADAPLPQPSPTSRRLSRDTLLPADLRHAWSGPSATRGT